MWLTMCASSLQDGSPQTDDPGSPPLEGGEALCELLLDANPILEKTHLHLLTNLPSYLEDHNVECLHDVFPAIQEALPTAQPEVQLAASNSFLTILEKELVPHATFTQTFLQSILASVDSKDPIVANAWVETLLDVIDLLPKDVIRQEILSLAVAKGQISQPVTSRLSCCRMLGKLCEKFEPYLIKKEILPTVQSLCQDVDYEVRGCMCRQLDAVARGLGLEATKSAILPELVELANDEESYVQLAGIETVVNMLSLLDDETCTQIIVPLVKKFCENSMKSEDITLPVIAKQLGKLCHGLSVNLTFDQKLWFLEFYRQVARLGLPHHKDDDSSCEGRHPPMPDIVPRLHNHDKDRAAECRYCCAYNFPAMVLFAGPKAFKEQLYETFHDLACDPYVKVRRTIASGLHEVAKLLGPCVHLIEEDLISLLSDDSLEVLKGLIAHLPVTLEAIAKDGTMGNEFKLTGGEEVMTAVMLCEEEISKTSNWRLHAQLLEKLSCLPKCLPSNLIFHKFVPLFFQKLFTARPIPCRMAAASTLLVYLKFNPRQDQRQELCQRLIEDLCNGRSCHTRILFISVCDLVMENFSKTFFKDNFFLPLLGLAEDPVPNVRLRLCRIIPRLKTLLKFPLDGSLLTELEICVGKLMIDEEDRDVSAAVRTAIAELDKIEVPVEISSRRSTNVNSCLEGISQLDDDNDQKKNHEELIVNELEEKRSSPVPVPISPEKKPLKTLGKIPVRRSIGGKISPEMKRRSMVITPVSTTHLRSPSPTSVTAIPTVNYSVKTTTSNINGDAGISHLPSSSLSSSVSRIPTLSKLPSERARSTTKTNTTTRKYTSPPRPSPSAVKPVIPSRTSIGSPVPSPESVRRVIQSRSYAASTISTRRKSVGPGTLVSSTATSRVTTTSGSRTSVICKQTATSPSHIPRKKTTAKTEKNVNGGREPAS